MIQVLASVWALLTGIFLLMIGNGLQGSLIGIRGNIENFTTTELSIITSAYFAGFLFGSRIAPDLIRRVGHVRVFAALGSFVSAILIMYPTITDPWVWVMLRVMFGFCFSGVYVTAESWLNNASSNETRGQALSLYLMAQMGGIVASQMLLNVADPAGYVLFVIPSVLVSLSFAPILLSATRTPSFETTKPMSLRTLIQASPLGVAGIFLLGTIFAAQFGMASVYGTQAGFTVAEISIFISAIFVGGLLFQYPFGWFSDRMDRRWLIVAAGVVGALAGIVGVIGSESFTIIVIVAFIMGGMSNPLYGLLLAYVNDYLDVEDMAAASGGLLFINGVGAVLGPILTGWMLTTLGPRGFWIYLAVFMALIAVYALYRMTQRQSVYQEEDDYEATTYAPVMPTSTAVAIEAAGEYYAENAESDDSTEAGENADSDEEDVKDAP